MISNIMLAIIGFLVGTISNRIKLFGNAFVNFALAVFLFSLHYGLIALGFSGFPIWLIILLRWYFVGTFLWKLLALIPIPILQQIARNLS